MVGISLFKRRRPKGSLPYALMGSVTWVTLGFARFVTRVVSWASLSGSVIRVTKVGVMDVTRFLSSLRSAVDPVGGRGVAFGTAAVDDFRQASFDQFGDAPDGRSPRHPGLVCNLLV